MAERDRSGQIGDNGAGDKQREGSSSFALYDSELVLDELGLKDRVCFLDLGCGTGDYSLRAAKRVGKNGKVYALDKWEEVIKNLSAKAILQGMHNMEVRKSDIIRLLPLENNSIDVCLLATVLHIPDIRDNAGSLFAELKRVLKPDGRLAVVEIKKEQTPYGPSMAIRLSPQEVDSLATAYGFKAVKLIDLDHFYMVQFTVR